MSANVDPNVVGAILVVGVIGFIALYAWIEMKKRFRHSTSYRHEPSGHKIQNEYQHRRDPYEEGFEYERGRQDAIEEAREQKRQDREWKRSHPVIVYDPPTYEVKDPFTGEFPSDRKKRKRKQDYW